MTILTWIWAEDAKGSVSPDAIYYALRVVMFILSFVLEDWAIFELVHSPRHRKVVVVLVASSYVTWTFQTHTFSNSLETLLVAWSLVLIDRITLEKVGSVLPQTEKISAYTNVATVIHWVMHCSFVPFCFRHLQSCYFSSFHIDTRHATTATLFE